MSQVRVRSVFHSAHARKEGSRNFFSLSSEALPGIFWEGGDGKGRRPPLFRMQSICFCFFFFFGQKFLFEDSIRMQFRHKKMREMENILWQQQKNDKKALSN